MAGAMSGRSAAAPKKGLNHRKITIGLLRHGSIQSVTAWDPENAPRHSGVANEYIKTMACCAVCQAGRLPTKALFLGLGAGTLPSLLLHENADYVAVELDQGAAELATEYLGLQGVGVRIGDALDHASIAPGLTISSRSTSTTRRTTCRFCDRPSPTVLLLRCRRRRLRGELPRGERRRGRARGPGGARLSGAFGELLAAPVRYQGNRVFVAGAGVVGGDAVAAAERPGCDPRSRQAERAGTIGVVSRAPRLVRRPVRLLALAAAVAATAAAATLERPLRLRGLQPAGASGGARGTIRVALRPAPPNQHFW